VHFHGREGLFDDVVGRGWQLLVRSQSGPVIFDENTTQAIKAVGIVVAQFGPQGDTQDLDGIYNAWFDRLGMDAVLVRPDLYIFGSSPLAEVAALVSSCRSIMTKAEA
jgi:ABC-type amino acid transport substrate-binding protein